MIQPQTVLLALALSVALTALLIAARFVWIVVDALRARRFLIAIVSAASVVLILTMLAGVVIVWFIYAVAHTGKDTRSDLVILFSTVPPFFVVSIGLWLLGNLLRSRLRTAARQQNTGGAHSDQS